MMLQVFLRRICAVHELAGDAPTPNSVLTASLMSTARTLRCLASSDCGASAVELAFVLPVFLMFLFGVTEIGRAVWIRSSLQYAVEDAARCAAINATGCGNVGAIQSYAAGRVVGATIPTSAFSVTNPSCGSQVSVSFAFKSTLSNLVPISVNLTALSCHP